MPDVAEAFTKLAQVVAQHKPHIIKHGCADDGDYAELSRIMGELADAVRMYFREVLADARDCTSDSADSIFDPGEVYFDLDALCENITGLFDKAAEDHRENREIDR
jgi:hypothetical protein